MSDYRPNISVVIPVHNEEANLEELYHRLTTVLDALPQKYEIIFRSFIPQKYVNIEMDPTQLVRNIHFHGGDNRIKYQFNPSFNYEGGSQSYRTTQNNDIDFPTKKTTFTFQQANYSRGYNVGHKEQPYLYPRGAKQFFGRCLRFPEPEWRGLDAA